MARIMIIDDDVELAGNLQVFLEGEGHTVTTLDSTDGAVEKLLDGKPDILILDVMLPDNPAAGFDLARKIRGTPGISKLPVILLTSVNQQFPMNFSSGDIDPDWMPVQDFLEKPAKAATLLRKVNRLLKER